MEEKNKIKCNVSSCENNCVENCSCTLENITICPCHNIEEGEENIEKESFCDSYKCKKN